MKKNLTKEILIENIKDYLEQEKLSKERAMALLDELKLEAMEEFVQEGHFVLKKKNKIQKFDADKLYNSIANASDDAKRPMTRSDIDLLIDKVKKYMESSGKNLIHTNKIRDIVMETLKDYGFKTVAEHYEKF
ncbi:MAG: ATP cone domain-containing protein [Tissierellia bacterium]|nr:ATP cone domain-containing protein [Tissierellia bacterium]